MIEFRSRSYYDDRMYLLYLCKGTTRINEDGFVESKIYHESAPEKHHWCVVTYENYAKYPAHSIRHFRLKEGAMDYLNHIDPITPLVSLGGASPQPRKYSDYVQWKKERGYGDYDFKKAYTPGGSNHVEIFLETKDGFMTSNIDWAGILESA